MQPNRRIFKVRRELGFDVTRRLSHRVLKSLPTDEMGGFNSLSASLAKWRNTPDCPPLLPFFTVCRSMKSFRGTWACGRAGKHTNANRPTGSSRANRSGTSWGGEIVASPEAIDGQA